MIKATANIHAGETRLRFVFWRHVLLVSLFLKEHLNLCYMLTELARRDLVFKHLIYLGRCSAGNFWQDKESDDTRDDTGGSEADEVSDILYKGASGRVGIQVSRSNTPSFEHEWNRVVEGNPENERAHQGYRSSSCPQSLGRYLGDVGVGDAGTTDDSVVGHAAPEYLN